MSCKQISTDILSQQLRRLTVVSYWIKDTYILSTGKLLWLGLNVYSVVGITDQPDRISPINHGCEVKSNNSFIRSTFHIIHRSSPCKTNGHLL